MSPVALALNKLVVSAYRSMGFAMLSAILLGLASYIVINLFFLVNRSWIEPTIVSPNDPRVLDLESKLVHEHAMRDKLQADRRDVMVRFEDAERAVALEEGFQQAFRESIATDLADREAALVRFAAVRARYAQAKAEIEKSRDAFSGLSRARLGELFATHIIDEDAMVTGHFQLGQIAEQSLMLEDKHVDIVNRVQGLQREVESLEQVTRAFNGGQNTRARGLTYGVLRAKHDFDKSIVDGERAKGMRDALKETLAEMDATNQRHEALIKSIETSPLLRAVGGDMLIAFVPYENSMSVNPGDPIFGCAVRLVWCKKVGVVREVLDGEVTAKHPLHNSELRGVFIETELRDAAWARDSILHVGGAPLLI